MKVNYNLLKNAIIRSAKQTAKNTINFKIDPDILSDVLTQNEIPLSVLSTIGMESKSITIEDIPYLSEFFKGEKLSWITEEKQFTTLVFAIKSDEADSLIEVIETDKVDAIIDEIDRVNAMADLLANYPCYIVTIISYRSNDPKRIGKPSYEIKCRANTVSLKMERSEDTEK